MKKIFFLFFSLILILILIGAVLWIQKSSVISLFLSKRLGAPVSMKEMIVFPGGCKITHFHIRNIPPCKTSNALLTETITCKATLQSLFQHRAEIESIRFENIDLGVEFLDAAGDKNNWTVLLGDNSSETKKSRPYLIQTLIFDDIHVTITERNGSVKKVPPIAHLEFHDITDESGFPIQELEKAILHSMMQSIFKNLGIKTFMKMLNPSSLPKFFHFPFMKNDSPPQEESLELKD